MVYNTMVKSKKERFNLRFKYSKPLAFFITLALLCSGCGQPDKPNDITSESTETEAVTTEAATLHAEALANEEDVQPPQEERALKIAANSYSYTYSPFSEEGEFDALINDLTGVHLIGLDRSGNVVKKGIEGERRYYNGVAYSYTGIADISESYNEEDDETVFSITLRDDVEFSDGETLDADDLIFTLYMLLDPSMSKKSALQDVDIKGAVNYRLNSAIADTLTSEDISDALKTEEVCAKIREELVVPMLNRELEWVKSLYGDKSYSVYTEAYPNAKDLMAFFYSVNSEYDSSAASEEQVLSDLADMYGGNYELLGSMYEGDSTYFKAEAEFCAIEYLSEQAEAFESVNRISGIIRKGDFTVDVVASGKGAGVLSALNGVIVAPLHYYGNEQEYSYSAGKFGFEKGKALELITEKADKPFGAGAYVFDKSENGVVYLTANEYYYKGVAKTKNIEISQTSSDSAVSAVSDGKADISYPEASAQVSEEIEQANDAIEKLCASTINSDGYGFIGINSKTVNIGGEPCSEESVALRKALSTAIYLFRDDSIRNYYGDIGIAVDYPASVSAFVDEGYVPYSMNAVGESLYTDGMTAQVQRAAAKKACLGYFEAAGYTVENERVMSAPENGTTTFHATIAAEGKGEHPSYYALESASKFLNEIGITLVISDVADAAQLWNLLNSGTQEIWVSVWETGVNPRFSAVYGEDNYYGITDKEFYEAAAAADDPCSDEISEIYGNFYYLLYDRYAVEIPMYQRSSCVLFSTLRVDSDSVPRDMTCYYSWIDEAERITQKNG